MSKYDNLINLDQPIMDFITPKTSLFDSQEMNKYMMDLMKYHNIYMQENNKGMNIFKLYVLKEYFPVEIAQYIVTLCCLMYEHYIIEFQNIEFTNLNNCGIWSDFTKTLYHRYCYNCTQQTEWLVIGDLERNMQLFRNDCIVIINLNKFEVSINFNEMIKMLNPQCILIIKPTYHHMDVCQDEIKQFIGNLPYKSHTIISHYATHNFFKDTMCFFIRI